MEVGDSPMNLVVPVSDEFTRETVLADPQKLQLPSR